jgi:hypothetical protein
VGGGGIEEEGDGREEGKFMIYDWIVMNYDTRFGAVLI